MSPRTRATRVAAASALLGVVGLCYAAYLLVVVTGAPASSPTVGILAGIFGVLVAVTSLLGLAEAGILVAVDRWTAPSPRVRGLLVGGTAAGAVSSLAPVLATLLTTVASRGTALGTVAYGADAYLVLAWFALAAVGTVAVALGLLGLLAGAIRGDSGAAPA